MSAPELEVCSTTSTEVRGDLVFRGFLPQSFSDYTGKIAAVLFTGGCNLRCRYCYNRSLVLEPEKQPAISPDDALSLLKPRTGFLDAVVVTGGEPTLQRELPAFLRRLRPLGFLAGVDTNGSNPRMLRTIIDEQLVDRLAMDYKAPLDGYEAVTGNGTVAAAVAASLRLLVGTPIPHEVRVTIHPALHDRAAVVTMGRELTDAGILSVALQNFKPWDVLDESLATRPPYREEELQEFARFFPGRVVVR